MNNLILLEQYKKETGNLLIPITSDGFVFSGDYVLWLESKIKTERFTMPTFDQLIQIAIMVNGGKIQKRKLADMIAMCEFILPRLQEHGTVEKPAKGEEL